METYGTREIVKNSSILRIDENDFFMVEDKKSHKQLGIYLGINLANQFLEFHRKERLLKSAEKIRENAKKESEYLSGTLNDGL